MPVATRSCSKQKRRPRIEDETPATTNTNRSCRYVTRSSTKRKILLQNNEVNDQEPPPKRATSIKASKRVPRITSNPSSQSKCRSSRTPKWTAKDNKTVSSFSNKEHENKENHNNESQIVEKGTCMSPLNPTHDGNEAVVKTPADSIAARIRSFSDVRRSKWRKNNNGCSISNNQNSSTSPVDGRSPLGEVSFNPTAMEIDTDSDEDILWKMSRHCSPGEKRDLQDSNSDDEISYKKKYLTMMTAMKQLQNTFLRAQQNAERSVKAYDKFSNELKSSLSIEKQKNSLLSEELKIKKGTMERLRSDLENVKEQLQYVKEEKMNIEKHNQEHHEKETILHNGTAAGQDENSLMQQIEDQKRVNNFYSLLTGVSVLRDHTCEDSSSFQSFNCTFFPATNTSHCLQFRLTHDKEFDEIEYSPNPRSPGAEDVVLNLPKYLQENIFFGADQAPRFLAKLLKPTE